MIVQAHVGTLSSSPGAAGCCCGGEGRGSWWEWAERVLRLLCEADVSRWQSGVGSFSALREAELALVGEFGPAGVRWTLSRVTVEGEGASWLTVTRCTACGPVAGQVHVPDDCLRPGASDVLLVMFS